MSVYTLPYNSREKISAHISAQEVRCKCGGTHNITINTELIDKIEKLISVIAEIKGVSSNDIHINISSANRCKARDISVGGSGWGQHVVGKAFDFNITYKGEPVSSKLIACIAQELGFTGIGRIQSVGEYIHCDVGSLAEHGGKKWLGDETVKGGTSGSVINEPQTYWNYYGLNRNDYFKSTTNSGSDKIKELQNILNSKGSHLAVDGICGKLTLAELKKYSIEFKDKGTLTKWVQEVLNAKGFDSGEADGICGAKTVNALNNWQKANNLGVGKFYGTDWETFVKGV